MSQTIPAFVQYQQPVVPLRGLWNNAPPEGPYFVNFTLPWGSLAQPAVQFSLSGNSPVALSQIVALSVDNSRCGSDVDFLFPDSGFVLTVPAHNQGVFPVFTNALMFYAIASGAGSGDLTVFQALNGMPPPVAVQPSEVMNHVSETGIPLHQATNATIVVLPPPTSGLLTGFSIMWGSSTDSSPSANLDLVDGTSKILWAGTINTTNGQINVNPLNVRFTQGISIGILGSDYSTGTIFVNLYYTSP